MSGNAWRYRECWGQPIEKCDHCGEVISEGHGLEHSLLDRLPAEVQVKIGVEAYNARDLTALGQTCGELSKVVASAWAAKVEGFLRSHGSDDPQRTQKVFTKHNALITGPGLVAIMFEDVEKQADTSGWGTRLEVYIPIDKVGKDATIEELKKMGYRKDYDVDGHADVKRWANEYLFYPQFGTTIRRLNLFIRRRDDGEEGICVLFESRFVGSAVPSITEQPSTLLMNYIDGSKIHILYPHLTLKQKGVVNISAWSSRLDKLTMITHLRKAGMTMEWDLTLFEGFKGHRCYRTLTCPGRDRTEDDGAKMEISFKVGVQTEQQNREEWVRTLFRKAYVSWRLKCAGSCYDGNGIESYAYAVARYTVGDVTHSSPEYVDPYKRYVTSEEEDDEDDSLWSDDE